MTDDRPLVFVLDGDRAVRDALKFALELEELDVQVCERAHELLVHPRLGQAACLVVDVQMPVMGGCELVEALRARGLVTPVILITSRITGQLRRRARAAGVRHVVEKPLLDSVLLETLQTLLQARQPQL